MNYRTLLFDFDGTLAATLPAWRQAYRLALESYGVEIAEEDIVSRCFYTAYSEVARSFGIADPVRFEERVSAQVRLLIPEMSLYPFFDDLVRAAKKEQLLVGLVTTSWRGIVEPFLESVGIRDHFDCLTTCEDVAQVKPHPEPIFHALRTLDSRPEEALFVGDSMVDILAGRAAGVDVALFFPEEHHAYYSLPALRDLDPRFTISSHLELFEIVLALRSHSRAVSCAIG